MSIWNSLKILETKWHSKNINSQLNLKLVMGGGVHFFGREISCCFIHKLAEIIDEVVRVSKQGKIRKKKLLKENHHHFISDFSVVLYEGILTE